MTLIAAADGSALGNPGPAGWAWFIDADRWASGGWPHGTNNMGELTAVLDLLQQTASVDDELLVYCDSMYVINSITKWMPGWKRKGWRKGDGKPVLNVEIMKALDVALQGRRVRFEWVKGHAGHELNEEADRLANAAAVAFSKGAEPEPGPGFGADGSRPSGPSHPASAPDAAPPVDDPDDLFSAFDVSDSTYQPTEEERVIALERSLLTAEVRADRASVAALLHPAWSEVGRTGRVWSRDDVLDTIAPLSPPVSLDVLSVSRVGENAILLVWRALGDRRATVRSSLWLRERGIWRQRFHQGTDESEV